VGRGPWALSLEPFARTRLILFQQIYAARTAGDQIVAPTELAQMPIDRNTMAIGQPWLSSTESVHRDLAKRMAHSAGRMAEGRQADPAREAARPTLHAATRSGAGPRSCSPM